MAPLRRTLLLKNSLLIKIVESFIKNDDSPQIMDEQSEFADF